MGVKAILKIAVSLKLPLIVFAAQQDRQFEIQKWTNHNSLALIKLIQTLSSE